MAKSNTVASNSGQNKGGNDPVPAPAPAPALELAAPAPAPAPATSDVSSAPAPVVTTTTSTADSTTTATVAAAQATVSTDISVTSSADTSSTDSGNTTDLSAATPPAEATTDASIAASTDAGNTSSTDPASGDAQSVIQATAEPAPSTPDNTTADASATTDTNATVVEASSISDDSAVDTSGTDGVAAASDYVSTTEVTSTSASVDSVDASSTNTSPAPLPAAPVADPSAPIVFYNGYQAWTPEYQAGIDAHYTQGIDGQAAVDALVSAESGITIVDGSIHLDAASQAVAVYDGWSSDLGIGRGLVLTSGTVAGFYNTTASYGVSNNLTGDAGLDQVVKPVFNTTSYDAASLEFSFNVNPGVDANSVSFDIVFGSDEFPEWMDSYVDSAAVWVNGTNYALFNHNAYNPLSVVHQNVNAGYFINNTDGHLATEYDGVSQLLRITAPIHAGENTIRIAIADTGDHILDSAIYVANFKAGVSDGSGVTAVDDHGSVADDSVEGTQKAEYFNLSYGDDSVNAGLGDDIVDAGEGDDLISGDSGDDALDGGVGDDSARYHGNRADFQVNYDAVHNTYTVTDLVGNDGTDTLSNIEHLHFDDGTYAIESLVDNAPSSAPLTDAPVDAAAVIDAASPVDAVAADTVAPDAVPADAPTVDTSSADTSSTDTSMVDGIAADVSSSTDVAPKADSSSLVNASEQADAAQADAGVDASSASADTTDVAETLVDVASADTPVPAEAQAEADAAGVAAADASADPSALAAVDVDLDAMAESGAASSATAVTDASQADMPAFDTNALDTSALESAAVDAAVVDTSSGIEQFTGGASSQLFVFAAASDGYVDLVSGQDGAVVYQQGDLIDLSQIDAIVGTSTDDAFTYLGSGDFTGEAGQLHFDAATGNLTGDVDGDGQANFQIHLAGLDAAPSCDSFQL
ncbi:MAG: hypothetical protein RIQ60_3916 [Pseudomonadota bacterium]|jgi:hypothetical protein